MGWTAVMDRAELYVTVNEEAMEWALRGFAWNKFQRNAEIIFSFAEIIRSHRHRRTLFPSLVSSPDSSTAPSLFPVFYLLFTFLCSMLLFDVLFFVCFFSPCLSDLCIFSRITSFLYDLHHVWNQGKRMPILTMVSHGSITFELNSGSQESEGIVFSMGIRV